MRHYISVASSLILTAAGTCANATTLPSVFSQPSFFPISVWWQQANEAGHSGPYPTIAAATAAAGINIMLGQGANWPETFGADNGEFEAIKQNGLFLIGGVEVPWNENSSNTSVASILALAQSIGAGSNLLGYNAGDEPNCNPSPGQTAMSQVPTMVAGIQGYDSTRLVTFNHTAWMNAPEWLGSTCLQQSATALQSASTASFDLYPLTKPWWGPGFGTDYNSVPNDTLWMQGLTVQALVHFAQAGQPIWAYIESGSDNFGFSEQNNSFSGSVSTGSTTLVSNGSTRFGPTWLGLTVSGSGIPSGTTISNVIDSKHAQMSKAAMASGSSDSVAVSGGTKADCVAGANICVVNGNEYRPTPQQVTAEVWMSIINGANGIEYFCHDSMSYSFCLGDSGSGGAAATATFNNLKYIDGVLMRRAPMLNDQTVAQCSMDNLNYSSGQMTTAQSCSSSNFKLSTNAPAIPGAMLIKSHEKALFVIAQSSRRGSGGATFTFTLPTMINKTATVVYDSNHRYDNVHSSIGAQFAVNAAGQFSDKIGAYDDYQVKIYRVQ